MKKEFIPMTKEERIKTYGGFAWLAAIPVIATLVQTVVSSGVAIYQAVREKSGSVSFGGSKTITQKYSSDTHNSQQKGTKIKKVNVSSFSAY
ncbi:hypothetical protein [Mycoplasma todarodis]|uniref:hypothetical protein n=1 Tax=Mycoplasma todarodis TaxID=1937191 RepID=UPI003B30C4AB